MKIIIMEGISDDFDILYSDNVVVNRKIPKNSVIIKAYKYCISNYYSYVNMFRFVA